MVGLFKRPKQADADIGLDADAVVPDLETKQQAVGLRLQAAHPHQHTPHGRELEGVVGQVQQDLLEPQGVARKAAACQPRVDVDDEFQRLYLGPLVDEADHAVQNAGKLEVDLLQRHALGLDLRQVEDVVDQFQEVLRGLLHLAQLFAQHGFLGAVQGQTGHAQDGVHPCAQLMAHVGQEAALGTIGGLGTDLGL